MKRNKLFGIFNIVDILLILIVIIVGIVGGRMLLGGRVWPQSESSNAPIPSPAFRVGITTL